MDGNKIVQHLVDISMGVCSITDESILKLDNKEDQMIELGLLTFFEEIEYNKKMLEDSVKEKEVLLKEIHHRVKNNLQIISSLLNLQNVLVDDEKTKSVLLDCRSRVRSMSLIHEKLLRSQDFDNFNYKDYLEELVEEIKSTHSYSPNNLNVHLDIAHFKLGLDTAIPLGLIINEIFTNSMKYGLNKDEKNEIYVQVKEVELNSFEMKIGDNGSGYSDDIFNTEKNTLGVQLIRDLTTQIDGTIEKLSDPEMKGTHYHIQFEVPDA
jgi:two-component sensor histidine kinase